MSADIDDQIEDYLAKLGQDNSGSDTDSGNRGHQNKDNFWIVAIGGAIVNIIFFFIIPFTFALIGGFLSGCFAGSGVRRGVIAGFLSGLFSGIIIILLFFIGAGLQFSAVMLAVQMSTGINPIAIICVISLALGALYSIIGAFGGGLGGFIARLFRT